MLEFLVGGGADELNLTVDELHDIAAEGRSMLQSLIEDLTACGHDVITVLDPRCFSDVYLQDTFLPNAEKRWLKTNEEWRKEWHSLSANVDRLMIIAPEIDGILSNVEQEFRPVATLLQLSSAPALALASDKLKLANESTIQTWQPLTWSALRFLECTDEDLAEVLKSHSEDGFDGWVVKSRFGAGCDFVQRHSNAQSTRSALQSIVLSTKATDQSGAADQVLDSLIVQPWLIGEHYSLSVIASPDEGCNLVGMLKQDIVGESLVQYQGGSGPFFEGFRDCLDGWCSDLLSKISGLRGWIGVDVVLTPDSFTPSLNSGFEDGKQQEFLSHLRLIEINPRLTSSYLGFRQLYGSELSEGVLGISDRWRATSIADKNVQFDV